MYLTSLTLNDFRIIKKCDLEFSKGVTAFIGDNGQGKTSILESIFWAGHCKSFRHVSNDLIIKNDAVSSHIRINLSDDIRPQDIVATIKVLEFPPKLSLSRHVSLESLYGIWTFGLSLARALITIPRVVKDLLIFPASFSRSPVAIVIFCLSEPARSTKCSLGVFNTFFPSIYDFMASETVKIE